MKLLFENLPPSLAPKRAGLAQCLEAMNRVMTVRAIYLFGSHARGDARPDSDVDLCIVADGAAKQLEAAQSFSREMRPIPSKPSFTLIPITPDRLTEKNPSATISSERCSRKEYCLPRKTDSHNPADWLLIAASDMELVRVG